ncbi:unnamed protein product [Pylaiella littoralis]
MAWATVMKLRKALLQRAGEIYEERHPSPPGESPIKGEDLTSEQLESVAEAVFEELGNMDLSPVQHEMPVETTLEKTGAKDARISTGGKEKERFTLCFAVMTDGGKVPCASSSRVRRSSRRPSRRRAGTLSRSAAEELHPGATRGSAPCDSRRAGSCAPTTGASSSSAQASWSWTTSSATEARVSSPTS